MQHPIKKIILILTVGIFILAFCSCTKKDEIPPYYYIVLTFLVGDGGRPYPPSNLDYTYIVSDSVVNLFWEPGSDRELPTPPLYRVYLYLNSPPTEFYGEEYLLGEAYDTFVYFQLEDNSKKVYTTVTSYDGFSESKPAPYLTIDPQDSSKWETPE